MLLRTENLTKQYGTFRALDSLNLTLNPGEVFGLLGPNGSGKTTTLRLIMGFLRPSAGAAWIQGHHTWNEGVQARSQIAYLPGELRLYENMTGRQLIRFLCDLRGQTDRSGLEDLARRFDIEVDRPIAHLSSGMKRKVALLQVLIIQAPLVIMDEPTNALDPIMRDELLEQVRRAKARGQAVLFSSHVLREVEEVCDRVGILQQGRLVHEQRMAELSQGRTVHLRFPGDPPNLPRLDGLQERERSDGAITLEYRGEMPRLLEWLTQQPLTALKIEPLGLTPIYQRYHGGPA